MMYAFKLKKEGEKLKKRKKIPAVLNLLEARNALKL